MRKFIFGILFLGILAANVLAAEELVIYSARKEPLIKPLFDTYTAKTGVAIKFITDKEGPLLQRLLAEGAETPADILMTSDAGNLWQSAQEGLFASVESPILEKNIPAHLRDPENHWFGLSIRARTIVYHTGRVNPADLSTYEDLGDLKWRGRLCLRTSKKVYNQSLVAMMIESLGKERAEAIVRAWVENLAVDVFADDTRVMEAMAAGQCDVGIVNTYYYGRLLEEKPGLALALFWPDQNGGGVHVNISGAGIIKYSKKQKEALSFLEWLSSEEAQGFFANANLEYPANPQVPSHPLVASWGAFKPSEMNLAKAGELQQEAVMLMDRAGYK